MLRGAERCCEVRRFMLHSLILSGKNGFRKTWRWVASF